MKKDRQQIIEQTLDFITKEALEVDANEFLKKLSIYLKELFNVDYVLIGKYDVGTDEKTETLTLYGNNSFLPNIIYSINNTPCEKILNGEFYYFNSNIQTLFPNDKHLIDLNVNSYIGIPLWNNSKKPVGLIALLDKNSFSDVKTIELVLKIVSIKAAQLIEKIVYENKLQKSYDEIENNNKKLESYNSILRKEVKRRGENLSKSEKRFNKILDSFIDAAYVCSPNYNITYQNKAMEKLIGGNKLGEKCYKVIYKLDNKCDWCVYEKLKTEKSISYNLKDEYRNQYRTIRNILLDDGSKMSIYHNTTEAIKAQKEIKKFSTLVEQSPATIVITDLQGCIEYANPQFEKSSGYTIQEAIGKNPKILKSKNSSNTKYINLWNTITQGKSWFGELLNLNKNGEEYWERAIISSIKNDNGEIQKYFAIKEDITERKQIEKALKESEEKARITLNTSNDIIILCSPEGIIYDCNETYCKKVNVKKEDIIGKNHFLIMTEERRTYREEQMQQVCKNRQAIEVIDTTSNAIYLTNIIPIFEDNEEITQIAIYARDITIRTKAEKALQDSQAKLKKALEIAFIAEKTAKLGAWDLNIKENKVVLSDNLCRLFEIEPDDFDGTFETLYSFFHFNDAEEMQNIIKEMIATKKAIHFELRVVTIDKKIKYVKGTNKLFFDKDKELVEIIGSIQDISETKSTEQTLIKLKEKAEESDRLKSSFLANMSHEIRTPMNAILGFANLLKNPNIKKHKKNKFLEIINSSGTHLLNLINDIIDISKIDAKQFTIIEKECYLKYFLSDLEQLFSSQLKTKNKNDVKFSINSNLLDGKDVIFTDQTRLRQILINLVGNAVKFTTDGYIKINYSVYNEDKILFSVEDTGIGIRAEELHIIFDRFRQVDEGLNRKYGGTGLGLAITKACVALLGGEIWVESELKKGSTFFFTINYKPVNKPIEKNVKIKIIDNDNIFLGKTILIVEDELYALEFLKYILEPTKANILHASDGLQAVDLCKNNLNIDIVLMDIQLPKLNGLLATKEILKTRPDLPIIAQTANAFHSDEKKSKEVGCVDYISKPINEEQLISKIARQLGIKN